VFKIDRTTRILAAYTALTCALAAAPAEPVHAQNFVPQPVSVEWGEATARLLPYPAVMAADAELAPLAEWLRGWLRAGRVRLSLDAPAEIPAEGYRLEVAEDGAITVAGRDYGGVWNGLQTLSQMMDGELKGTLRTCVIEDWPRMEYRGVMLDVARTFIPKNDVMRLIDRLARHKINRFHWHLTDDEGWRVEIRAYPRLTEIGAWRGPDEPIKPVYGAWDERYGGFYTQDDIREVVAFAAVRGVEIIPEIDLPGHSRAAARAYPEVLCDYTPSLSASAGYDMRNVLCVAREENYAMLDAVIAELAELFPSPTLHIGGDEVSASQWRQCPHCKALMAAEGITDAAALQGVFMARVAEIAARHGKRAGVWNEAVKGGRLPVDGTTVWGWETPAATRRVAAAGYPTIVCTGSYFYFDQRQSARDRGHIWAGVVSLEKVYSFTPAALGFTAAEARNIRGVEGTFFSELLLENGADFLDYQLFPRVCAIAEVGWSAPESRSWDDFNRRLTQQSADGAPPHLERLARMGIAYRAAEPKTAPEAPLKRPAATFTSSIPQSSRYPFTNVATYKTNSRTTRAPRTGDWFMWRFSAPVTAASIELKTGFDHLQRSGVPSGRVEVSYDGTTFETAARLHDLRATLSPTRPLRAIRVVCERDGNGEAQVIIQPLKIK